MYPRVLLLHLLWKVYSGRAAQALELGFERTQLSDREKYPHRQRRHYLNANLWQRSSATNLEYVCQLGVGGKTDYWQGQYGKPLCGGVQ